MVAAILALGSNLSGCWGSPRETLRAGLHQLQREGITLKRISKVYETAPIGSGRQPAYANIVVTVDFAQPPVALLRRLKAIERRSGRRLGRRWGPRTLDIDIVMAGTVVYGWPARAAGRLTLPHPEAHRRAFVLIPLLDVAPAWVHPALGVPARRLAALLPVASRRGVRAMANGLP